MSGSIPIRTLRAVTAVAVVALLMWSIGAPLLRWVEAANVTEFSNTLSDSAPSALSDHTISFVTPNGVAAGEFIEISFPSFTLGNIDIDDVDLAEAGIDEDISTNWTLSTTSNSLRLTSNGAGGTIAAGASTTIEIGTVATNNGTGNDQITNPAAGTYLISATVGSQDKGETRVMIIESVTVTASVDTAFTFTVAGVAGGQAINGSSTTGTSTPTAINFGTLQPGVASTSAHDLTVSTNAAAGYTVTVQTSGPFQSSNNGIIDGFQDGSDTDIPVTWDGPSPVFGNLSTYGHWGITSEDATTTRSNEFGSNQYIAASTSPRVIMSHNGPADASTQGIGTARVGYRVEISSLQEAGADYSTTITYVATPVF